MNPQENVKIVQQAYEDFKNGNIPALLESMADNVEWELPELEGVPIAGKRQGRDRVADFFATLSETQEVLNFEPTEFVAQGEKVVVLGDYTWRVKATGGRLPVTGRMCLRCATAALNDSRNTPILPQSPRLTDSSKLAPLELGN